MPVVGDKLPLRLLGLLRNRYPGQKLAFPNKKVRHGTIIGMTTKQSSISRNTRHIPNYRSMSRLLNNRPEKLTIRPAASTISTFSPPAVITL